ncbi:AlkA N-terminal domain-containing protein [Vallicoccus soli]|uniref:AlkA N-terminal domain-containing protein n=1 Tax=Vallicoccus soli TaxID=2339232 RepID=UPI001C4987F3|nr:AlkA N-terminal domain-containing protein [Vallicoccus soli]
MDLLTDDAERCYRAVQSRDPRFDGVFWTGVTSTGIYCRPSCPAVTPRRANVRFFRSTAAAQGAGLRACKRCRPDAVPGSPDWDVRSDVAGRAMRLIADGVVDREGVPGLARRLGLSERHLHRQLVGELGAGPLALARARRAHAARLLVETTGLPLADVAFAAGFSSVRQFNDTVREVYAAAPGELRAAAGRRGRTAAAPGAPAPGAGRLVLRLAARPPFDGAAVVAFLAAHAVVGVEEVVDGTYRRTLRLPHGPGVVALTPDGDAVRAELDLADLRDVGAAVERARRTFDLDADPEAVDALLGADPLLGHLVRGRPGLRVPGHDDGAELAVRAVLGQQVSLAAARTHAGRLVLTHGQPLAQPSGGLTHLFPDPEALADLDPATLALPRARGGALRSLAGALHTGRLRLERGVDRDEAAARLVALPGIGPWTASYVRLRALGDPDVFLPGDLAARKALAGLGVADASPAGAARAAAGWAPWRSYALLHAWSSLGVFDQPAEPSRRTA